MQKLFTFCRKHYLFLLGIFFVVFIPLFPKKPLFDVVGTWVDVRLEDFLVAASYFLLGILLLKNRKIINTPLTIPIVFYWIVGFISLVHSLIFIGPYLPGFFPKVAFLFYLRGIEYMAMFFLGFWGLYSARKYLPYILGFLAVTVLCAFIYGVGQKYQGWPAFSTMNEEFAKGIPLRLPPTARVMSTFAGHYDLAAYLVLVIPIIGSAIFAAKNKAIKFVLLAITFCGFILLLFTASRVSFGVYLVTISTMLWWQKKRWLIIPVIIISIICVNFVSGASERFLKTFRYDNVIVDLSTGKPIGTLDKLEGGKATLEQIATPDQENLPKGSEFINVPIDTPNNKNNIKTVELITKKNLASEAGEVATVSGSFLVQKAFVLDISITTRFQGQWPKAIAAFKRNILLGSGYSALSLASDGNYHRLLGETGLLGAISFMGIFIYCFYWFIQKKNQLSGWEKAYVIGFFAGIVGLLLNAILIDVFSASKVAFTLWLLLGFAMAILIQYPLSVSYVTVIKRFFINKWAFIFYLFLLTFILYGNSISHYFIGDDFTWLRWAAQSKISNIVGYFTSAGGFFYRPIPKLWYFILFTIFWLIPQSYHIASILLFGLSALFIAILLSHFRVQKLLIALLIPFYLVMSVHHESIYWISNHSHLLGLVTLLGSLVSLVWYWSGSKTHKNWFILGGVLLFISMFCYDIMVVSPIIIVLFGGVLYKQWKSSLPFLLFIPFYLFARHASGAVPPSGDYNYNLIHFIPNLIGNFVGYIMAILGGPKAIEYFSILRIQAKSSSTLISLVFSAILLGIGFGTVKYKNKIIKEKLLILLSSSYVLSQILYLGLGGITERYALYSSAFFILFVGVLLSRIWSELPRLSLIKGITIMILLLLVYWNFNELQRLGDEWKFASHVTEQTLKIMKKNFFPLNEHKTFVFINTPTKYGRAWIFPTGLNDALWHMYRESPFDTVQVSSVDAAFSYPQKKDSAKIIFEFDESYLLQQVVKQEVIQK